MGELIPNSLIAQDSDGLDAWTRAALSNILRAAKYQAICLRKRDLPKAHGCNIPLGLTTAGFLSSAAVETDCQLGNNQIPCVWMISASAAKAESLDRYRRLNRPNE